MQRRSFLRKAGIGLAGAGAAALSPAALAQAPEVKWRVATTWTKGLESIWTPFDNMLKRISEATGGKFQLQMFAAGEIVPAPGVIDAVKDGTVQAGYAAGYFYVGKDPTFAFDTALPFGMNTRQQTAWMYEGGGMQLLRDFFKEYNIYNIPCGNTTCQMGGWYRKEIKTVADLKGLKMRIPGLAGQVLQRLGVVPSMIPPPDVYTALEKGTIDATELATPAIDESANLNRVAKYYYYPSWWEGSAQVSLYVNMQQWNALPKAYQYLLEFACAECNIAFQTGQDAKNPPAMKRLVAAGTQLRPLSNGIMTACYKVAHELYDEIAAKNPKFKKVYEPWKKFRDEEVEWFSLAEAHFDNFMIAMARNEQRAAAKKKGT